MITITLSGRPISTNHLYRADVSKAGKPFTYMTTDGKNAKFAWQLEARHQFHKQRGEIFKEDNLSVRIQYYFENKARRDIDNYLKALLDCLTGVIWADDKQIIHLEIKKGYADKGIAPSTHLFVEEIKS